MEQEAINTRWDEAARVLTTNPDVDHPCPECDLVFLRVSDFWPKEQPGVVERHLMCPNCGACRALVVNISMEDWNDPVLKDVPSAFPEWLHDYSPLLESEKTNVVYEMYRRRRFFHGAWGIRLLRRYPVGLPAGHVIFLLVVPFLISAVGLFAWLFIPLVGMLLAGLLTIPAVMRRLAKRRQVNPVRMPFSVNKVFSILGIHSAAALDLWQSGLSGSEIAEAIYLEQRERRWLTTILFSIAVGAGLVLCDFIILPNPSWYATILFVFAAIYFLYELSLTLLLGDVYFITVFYLEMRVRSWTSERLLFDSLGESILEAVEATVQMAMLFLFILFAVFISAFLALVWHFLMPWFEWGNGLENAMLVGAVPLGLLMRLWRYQSYGWIRSRLKQSFADAKDAFDRYMSKVVMKDDIQ